MKKLKIVVSLAIVFAIAAAVFGGLWSNTIAERNELLVERNELRKMSIIVGWAYKDRGTIEALDNSDWLNEGFKVQLYRVVGKESVLVQEATVNSDGEYQFRVEPGTYYVIPVYSVPGYPSWGQITTLRYRGNILVEEGEYYYGSIFLVRENWGSKG